tara:strand:- start:221 stop:1297 length:1077 start_codon:yes stop_codon:yes gene_type:complete
MNKKLLLITGGTGGHVIPAVNFANYLNTKKITCRIIIDKRGLKYVKNIDNKIHIISSSNLYGNYLSKLYGIIKLIFGFVQSFIFILLYRPNKIISFGSYASFFPMLCIIILKCFFKIDIYLHEQNTVLGRTNKFYLRYSKRLFLNFNLKLKIKNKFEKKIYRVGSPEKNINYLNLNKKNNKKFTIFIFGGSQGSEYITNFSTQLIKNINQDNIIKAKFILQCPSNLISKIKHDLYNISTEVVIKDYYNNLEEILSISSVAVSRAGAGSINDLINFKIPSVLIPLPSSKDNHQFHNASILTQDGVAISVDQNKNEINKAKSYIYQIYNNSIDLNLIKNKFDKIKVKNSNSLIYKLICNE